MNHKLKTDRIILLPDRYLTCRLKNIAIIKALIPVDWFFNHYELLRDLKAYKAGIWNTFAVRRSMEALDRYCSAFYARNEVNDYRKRVLTL